MSKWPQKHNGTNTPHNFDEILNIDVKIDNINGPYKSGIDKRCHLKVRGKEHLVIDIAEVDENLDCAIDNAFQRLKKDMKRSRALQEKCLGEQVVIM